MSQEFQQYVVPVVAAMAGGIAALWKAQEARNAKQIEDMRADLAKCAERSDECAEDRTVLREELAGLKARVETIEADKTTDHLGS